MIGAQNNADWYAMMWDLRDLRYVRDAQGFRAIDPPPPYHGWATAVPGAPVEALIAPLLGKPSFAVKDGSGQCDLAGLGLVQMFAAQWLWHDKPADADTSGWEQITSATALQAWEAAWKDSSPSQQRQFPDAILDRSEVRLWGRRQGDEFDAGVIANLSDDCVGLSNSFGTDARGAATSLCAQFGQGRPLVGYERGDDFDEAIAQGWTATGPLAVWVMPNR